LCRPGEGFKPQRAWDFPQEILSAHLYKKRLSIADAASFARICNGEQMKRLHLGKQPVTEWALVVHHLRPRVHNGKGGAA
jgi:hypothetical protein